MPRRKNKKRLTWKQRKAIQLLVSGGMNDREVADYLGVHYKTLRRWQFEPEFSKVLEDRFRDLEKIDAKQRAKMNKAIVRQVYAEIIKRLSEGQTMKKISLKKLMDMARAFNHEIRVDTPGDATSRAKVEHNVLDDLHERFKKNKSKKPNLKLVELPEEEVSNG